LLGILRSILVTYSALTASLLLPPPPPDSNIQPEWQQHVEWIRVLSQNIMAAANDLRPMQARVNLELLMKRQLDLRRRETKTLHARCDALEAKLKGLRESFRNISASQTQSASMVDNKAQAKKDLPDISQEVVLKWAEGRL